MKRMVKYWLKQFGDNLQTEFGLKDLPDTEWHHYVETFVSKIKNINTGSSNAEQMFSNDGVNSLF